MHVAFSLRNDVAEFLVSADVRKFALTKIEIEMFLCVDPNATSAGSYMARLNLGCFSSNMKFFSTWLVLSMVSNGMVVIQSVGEQWSVGCSAVSGYLVSCTRGCGGCIDDGGVRMLDTLKLVSSSGRSSMVSIYLMYLCHF